jgi:hypothetical protein
MNGSTATQVILSYNKKKLALRNRVHWDVIPGLGRCLLRISIAVRKFSKI